MKIQTLKVKSERNKIMDGLNKIKERKEELMSKANFPLESSSKPASLTSRLLNMAMNDNNSNSNDNKNQVLEETKHFKHYVKIRIQSLEDQLAQEKDNNSNLITTKNVWRECINAIHDLEGTLRVAIENNRFEVEEVKKRIDNTVNYLASCIESSDNKILRTLILNEQEVLENAIKELGSTDKRKPEMIYDSSSRTSDNNSKKNISPPFLTVSKSPPKIGLSDKTTSGNLENLTVVRNNIKKNK